MYSNKFRLLRINFLINIFLLAEQALQCRLDKGVGEIVLKKDIAAVATQFLTLFWHRY